MRSTVALTDPPVLAAHGWVENGDLIYDCHRLGYLLATDVILDPTYGLGTWWKRWRPPRLVVTGPDADFRKLDFPDGEFDAIAFDPPYCAKGGRATSGMRAMDRRYGQDQAPATPALLQALINDGLTEMARLVKSDGFVLVKCMDYVSSGRLWIGTHWTLTHGLSLGLQLADRFEHVLRPRPQPLRTRADGREVMQHHARRNATTLFVFRK